MKIEDGFIILDNEEMIDDPNLRGREYGDSPSCWFKIDGKDYFFKQSVYYPEEPFFEVFMSRVVEAIGISTVKYHLAKLNGKIGVISLNYNTNNEKEITIEEVLEVFLHEVAWQRRRDGYPQTVGKLYSLDMIWEAIDYYYKNRVNREEIVKILIPGIVDSFLLQFITGNIDLNLSNISIIDNDNPSLAPNYDYGFCDAYVNEDFYIYDVQVLTNEAYSNMNKIIKHFFYVSDKSYFEYFKEKVSMLPNIDEIFTSVEKEIGVSIDNKTKEKYKTWYLRNKEALKAIINEYEMETTKVVK